MFEPIHGSAPKYTGKNVINPLATISAAQMMLDYLGEERASNLVEQAIMAALASGRLKDLSAHSGVSTSEAGDIIVDYINQAP